MDYALGYDGTTVEFILKDNTISSLENIGVIQTNNPALRDMYPFMPEIKDVNNWRANNAYFKIEDDILNIELGGRGNALDIFNEGIVHFEVK